MLEKAALEFGRAVGQLSILEVMCSHFRLQHPGMTVDTGSFEQEAREILANLKSLCEHSAMEDAIPEIDRFVTRLNWRSDVDSVREGTNHLRLRIIDDLSKEFYFHVYRRDAQLYGQKQLFGPEVAKKFKAAANDIERAGNCLALREPTACVFHLMRAMEVAVRRLSARLHMTITPQATWRQITGNMDGKIKAMPETTAAQKRKKNNWEAARANLHQVGSVWRNSTMHPAMSYTQSQALDVFNAVRVFMNELCSL